MALVPMEERLASKEKAWEVERRELTAKSLDVSRHLKVAEDRCQDLEKKKKQMEEERCGLGYGTRIFHSTSSSSF